MCCSDSHFTIPVLTYTSCLPFDFQSLRLELYSERIASCLKLSWQNRSLGRRGTTSLKGFSLPPRALTVVRPQLVTFSECVYCTEHHSCVGEQCPLPLLVNTQVYW